MVSAVWTLCEPPAPFADKYAPTHLGVTPNRGTHGNE
jgi:hypothetical protein